MLLLRYNTNKKAKGVRRLKKERNTIQKLAVKTTVLNMCNHPTADEVYDEVKKALPNISRATIYRVLNDLAEKGEIKKLRLVDGADRFDRTLCEHYHVKCIKCGKVEDISGLIVEGLDEKSENLCGYEIVGHEIGFEGICPECARNNTNK